MSNIDKQALREAAERAESDSWGYDRDEFNEALTPSTVLALLDELEAAEKKALEMPTFDGYVPHVARELQAAFRIACDNAGINVTAAGKGE
ncbi:TPA: ead/Ea22-like family protein [Enterobacter asburiae]|nr:ead/Ea22-like family protein [Enterobacter asburiae]